MKRIPRFPLRAAVQLLPAFYLIVLALLVLPGCSGGAVKRSSGDSAVLPYSVGVFLQESAGAGMDPLAAQAVLDATCNALQGDGAVVSRALSLSSRTIPAALREGRNMDFLVGVRLETETALPEPVVSSGAATLEVLTWLFGGIPSWFVPTLEYPLSGGMEMVVFDLNDSNTRSQLSNTFLNSVTLGQFIRMRHVIIDSWDQNVLNENRQTVPIDPLLECCSEVGHRHGAVQRHDA